MPNERLCGCKGIRTCLLCETENGKTVQSFLIEEKENLYTYCPHCNLCWSEDENASPLYLGKLNLFLEFLSEEEQKYAISDIDSIPWMPSQSGRRKQDFGPKVNFKKKKVRIGNFRGFPKFTDYIIRRIQKVPGLDDFQPVELCHLEYSPERGSSIDPHVDDFWLWGERLVTINLGSSTVLTLTTCSYGPCPCQRDLHCFPQMYTSMNGLDGNGLSCDHEFHIPSSTETPLESFSMPDGTPCQQYPGTDSAYITQTGKENSGHNSPDCQCATVNTIPKGADARSSASHTSGCRQGCVTERIKTMCELFRTPDSESKTAVRIVLPPRSLLVLAGCARYNWSHEIKRRDVVSRRLAMTFRELTAEFLDGGRESQFGKELLLVANNFIDL